MANKIIYEILPPENWQDLLPICRNTFVALAPMEVYLNITADEYDAMMPGGFEGMIKSHIAIVARDGERGKIVGALLLAIMKQGEQLKTYADLVPISKKVINYRAFVRALEEGYDVFKLHPEADYACETSLFCVRQEYQRRGIGSNLVKMADQIAAEKSCKYARVFVSALGSYKAFLKNGYEVVSELEYKSFEVDGVKIFDPKVVDPECPKSRLMMKKIQ